MTKKEGKRFPLSEPGPMLPPVPAAITSVKGKGGLPDELSVLWSFVLGSKPPKVGISAEEKHVAEKLLRERGEFVLNVLTKDYVEGFDLVDMHSYEEGNKYELAGFSKGTARKVDAPTVEEAAIQLECEIFDTIDLPPNRTVFFADVLTTSVKGRICDSEGRLIVEKVPFFGMTAGSGEFFTMGEKQGHIGMTADRDDILY